jgi:protein involved in polysaccharide export with SLBB domain
MRTFAFFLLFLMTSPATPGCAVTPTEWMSVLDGTEIIQKRQFLSIRILDDRQDAMQQQVTATGEISVPYIGLVDASGKTCRQLAFDIRNRLKPSYFQNPTVIVALDSTCRGCPPSSAAQVRIRFVPARL